MKIIERKEEIDDILIMCDSSERFPMFMKISKRLRGELYWYTLRQCYDLSDNLFKYRTEVKESFRREEPERHKLMSKREINYLNRLPDDLIIYRGMTVEEFKSGDFGVSWTLKKKVGEFFIKKYSRNIDTDHLPKMVHELKIKKSDVISYFGQRGEFEIIYLNN